MYFFKCIRGFLYENLLAVKVLTSIKNSWILPKSSFILLFSHCEPNWVRTSYFESDLRFWDCLLTRGLPRTSILVVVDRIYRCQLKANYLKDHRLFTAFFFHFWYLHEIYNGLRKNMSLISHLFLKLFTPTHVVNWMHNRSCFWKRFGSESVNYFKKFLKSTEKYFYPTLSSFCLKLS